MSRPTVMGELRRRAGIRQADLAARLDPPVSQPTVASWETRRSALPDGRRAELGSILGCDPARLDEDWDDYLLSGAGASL